MKTTNWKIEYCNDVGPDDDSFWEWCEVSNGERSFKCDDEEDAKWLLNVLSGIPLRFPSVPGTSISRSAAAISFIESESASTQKGR